MVRMNECKMKNKQNILFFLLVILFIANIFGTPPPPPPSLPPTTLIVSQAIPCNKNKYGKCLLVKVKENNKTEIITGIKNFAYDKDYIYTIEVKQINEPEYKYIYIKTLERVPINPPITLTIQKPTPCIDNSGEECLLVKRLDISKTETVRIKGFNYDERYICTIVVTELKNSTYDYNYERKLSCKPKPDSSYTIIIEKEGFDVKDYVKYRVEGTNDTIQFPIDHFINANFTIGVRNILKVKEVENNNQTYLEIVKQIEPLIYKQKPDLTITIEPFTDFHNIKYSYINKGVEVLETLDDTFIVGINLQKNILYKLKVKDIGTEYTKFKLIEKFLPKDSLPQQPDTVRRYGVGVLSYTCNGEAKNIASKNDIITTDYILSNNGNIRIKHIDIDEPLIIFTGKIFGFTFIEDHKYILEVKPKGDNYVLVNKLCDSITNNVTKPDTLKYPDFENDNSNYNPPYNDTLQNKPIPKLKPIYKINNIDSAIWYLRYLFQADSLTPINDLTNTSYSITTDISLDKINIITPCGSYDDKLRSYEKNKFIFESRTISFKKCDPASEILFDQLKAVNHYEINDNKLKLSVYNNDLQDAKVLIVLEGVPKKK